ncbi:hypothetical protein GLOIN_2v1721955 [Rhizophagus irregularis DAOM 181602=DAOM 197198]|uniref:Uncharacterized protein n=1 Tax=Rhizophagus irregularis (strain DAOM 181602 / DAOM 197198 / MUCL 43194) TaxID=747089 RepID=A0A2P4P236_RHIID|nr:hypothetical protein GLOIN_2v1721955 [Rhizophagus irregularis DAOM 181602=DAOM 197198]POG59441.1 hypothetical protein GLOIN_2v1721955 [Rhizophagus irregularis DAOM 181602=DAOM 197198]|eukprot:XP_025166307.1 hypothetical protein GLOIN_2v1721955 [Rhizophagus irregularis DAOM 181602=DAOM 197198]
MATSCSSPVLNNFSFCCKNSCLFLVKYSLIQEVNDSILKTCTLFKSVNMSRLFNFSKLIFPQ